MHTIKGRLGLKDDQNVGTSAAFSNPVTLHLVGKVGMDWMDQLY